MSLMRELPIGKVIHEINSYETDFVFEEVFQNRTYLKYGIEILDNDIIIDVGANIGLFSLFVESIAPKARVIAFEPSLKTYNVLKLNVSKQVECFNLGLGKKDGVKEFTYYPGYSVISGFHTDLKKDQRVIVEGEKHFTGLNENEVVPYISERFSQVEIQKCMVRSLSSIIRENSIEKIDLLKIDAEKSELDILLGIEDQDWKKIKQIVVEVHGKEESKISFSLLESQGFKVEIDEEKLMKDSEVYTLFGVRNEVS